MNNWYAIRTKANMEFVVFRYLRATDHRVFLPTYRSLRQWSDRMKRVDRPLFPGYLFLQTGAEPSRVIACVPGVVSAVTFCGRAAPIPAAQIESIQRLLDSGLPVKPHPQIQTGDRVVVSSGPLKGIEGLVVRINNKRRFLLQVHYLSRAVMVDIDCEAVLPAATSSVFPSTAVSIR